MHVAARIAGKAPSNDIFASNTVKDLVVGSGIKFADMGKHELKGIPGERSLYSVVQ